MVNPVIFHNIKNMVNPVIFHNLLKFFTLYNVKTFYIFVFLLYKFYFIKI